MAARGARYRRRHGHGHGPRHPQGVPRRRARAVLPGVHAPSHRRPLPPGAGHLVRRHRIRSRPFRDGGLGAGRRRGSPQERVPTPGVGPPARTGRPGRDARRPLHPRGRGQMEPPHGGSPSHHEHRRAGRDGRLGPRGRGAPAPLRPARLHHARGFRGRRRPAPGRARHPAGRRPAGDHRLRPAPGQLRRRAEGAAGPVARGLPRRHRTGDPRMGQRAHRRTRAGHDPRGPRVRRQRHRDPGPLPDPHGGRHQPLLPRRRDLPRDPGTDLHVRHPGRGRRRLGPLRGPGEGPPHRRLVAPWTGSVQPAR